MVTQTNEFIPLTVLVMSHIQDRAFNQPPMLCLLDSGATCCWISRTKIPSAITTNKIPAVTNQTLAGNFTSNESITLKNVLLPEFHRTRRLDTLQAKIFDQTCRYDMILGRNLMNDLGIVLNFDSKYMEWDKAIVAMREHPINTSMTSFATNLLFEAIDGGLDNNDGTFMPDKPSELHYQASNANPDGYKSKTISTSLYEPANLQDIVDKCTYLLPHQRQQLYHLLQKFQKTFDGKLKTFKGPPVHLQLIENPKPVRRRPYSVPTSHLTVFKAELHRLLEIGVIEKATRSEWIAGTFIVPKKDGRVRWITDFRGLNKASNVRFTHCGQSVKFFNVVRDTSSLQHLISRCNTTPFFSTNLPVISAHSLLPLGSTAIVDCPWASVNHPTLQPKRCTWYLTVLKILNFTWTILVSSAAAGRTIYRSFLLSCTASKRLVSP